MSLPVISYEEYVRLREHVRETRSSRLAATLLSGLSERYPQHEERRISDAVGHGIVACAVYEREMAAVRRRAGR